MSPPVSSYNPSFVLFIFFYGAMVTHNLDEFRFIPFKALLWKSVQDCAIKLVRQHTDFLILSLVFGWLTL